MRTIPAAINNLWKAGGPFIGTDGAPHSRVTVQPDWYLNTDSSVPTQHPEKYPFRWFQDINNEQEEIEVPNIRSVATDRNIGTDAASCTIVMDNQQMDPNFSGQNTILGNPGFYTWRYPNKTARARWDQIAGDWVDVLIPNALLRLYQGFGGKEKTIPEAVEDGNILLTGVWLIDEVRPGTDGLLNIKCRDMAKLLIEQQIYPPLVPSTLYPLRYSRWEYDAQLYKAAPVYDSSDPIEDSPGPLEGPKYVTDIAVSGDGRGYYIVGTDGGVFAYRASFFGSRGESSDNAPMVGIAADPLNRGYWLVGTDGGVFAFGEAGFYGSAAEESLAAPMTKIAAHPDGRGYWLVGRDGGVFAYGSAGFYGSLPDTDGHDVVDIVPTATGNGYWLLSDNGGIFTYGDAEFYGSTIDNSTNLTVGMTARPQGDGYWTVKKNGAVTAFGAAQTFSPNGHWDPNILNDPIFAISASITGNGYILVGGDGGVFSFGDGPFYGSLPADFMYVERLEGNYKDYSAIIEDLLRWSGWLAYGSDTDEVYGTIETTGAYSENELPIDMFDKQSVINPINQIKEIVGYIFHIDEEGAARFQQPNWYQVGNYMEDGTHVSIIPDIDEFWQITDYSVLFSDRDMRSEVIISSAEPTAGFETTVTTRKKIELAGLDIVRGMIRPAMWVEDAFVSPDEQATLADLIALNITRSLRQGNVTCPFNPAIQINDQVRIIERNTGESYIHYVRGISTSHDLKTGVFTMTLTTVWLADE